jgi:hypothetical protein
MQLGLRDPRQRELRRIRSTPVRARGVPGASGWWLLNIHTVPQGSVLATVDRYEDLVRIHMSKSASLVSADGRVVGSVLALAVVSRP